MRTVFLDFETFYADKYTLRTLSMEEYVRNAQFEPHLLGIAYNIGEVEMVEEPYIWTALQDYQVNASDTLTFIQNAKFDAFIASQYYNVPICNPICTRAMMRWTGVARLTRESLEAQCRFFNVGEKGTFIADMKGKHLSELTPREKEQYIAYCKGDVEQLRTIANRMLPYMTADALRFIIMTTKMYTEPVFRLDSEHLSQYYDKLSSDYVSAQKKLQHLFNFPTTEAFLKAIRSKKSFCELLESVGGSVPMKMSEKKSETARKKLESLLPDPDAQAKLDNQEYLVWEPALAKNDLGFMELMQSENADVAALATARAENNSSISMSRCKTFMEIGRRGTLPVALEAFQAHTGRYAAGSADEIQSDRTNIQNLSKRTGDKTLRKCVLPPDGYSIVACDSSQIEARMLAWLANEQWLLAAFREGTDPYCHMAADVYGESYETIHDWTKGAHAHDPDADKDLKARYKTYRNVGKTAVLQLGYYAGAGRFGLYLRQQGLMLAETEEEHNKEAQRIVKVYRKKNAAIKAFWGICSTVLTMLMCGNGYFGGPLGRTLYYDSNHNVFGHSCPGIKLPDGYWLLYPGLHMELVESRPVAMYETIRKGKKIKNKLHSGIICNNITQGLAFALMRWQALLINKRYPIRVNIHDSWGVICRKGEEEECMAYMMECMRTLPEWAVGLPVDCEAEIGEDFTIV